MLQLADEFQLPDEPPAHVQVYCAFALLKAKSRIIKDKPVRISVFNAVDFKIVTSNKHSDNPGN